MDGLIERYMNEETIRLMCFFLKNKFNPKDPCCKSCARFEICKRDAIKMIKLQGIIPWLPEDDIEDLIEKYYGPQRCKDCAF